MSRRDNMKRIFVGNLPPDVRTRDLENLFYKFGKIAFIDLKTRRGPPFAFVEFHDYRDAEEAVRCRDGKEWDGFRLRVEFPRGRERTSRFKNGSGTSRSGAPQRRSKFRVKVTGLPSSGSWQDLKDHMREVGEVCFADVYKGGEGVVEFVNYDDMRYAIKHLNNTKFKSHEGESSYIKLREDASSGDSRSRSRSPIVSRRRASPSYSPATKRRHSHSPSRSRSRSPKSSRRGGHHKRSSRRDRRSGSRSRSPISRSGSRSRSPSSRSGSRSRSPASRSPASRSKSRSPTRSRSHSPAPRGASPTRSVRDSRGGSRSNSRSPNYDKSPPARSSAAAEGRRSKSPRSASRSSASDSKRAPSKTPSPTPSPERNGSPARGSSAEA